MIPPLSVKTIELKSRGYALEQHAVSYFLKEAMDKYDAAYPEKTADLLSESDKKQQYGFNLDKLRNIPFGKPENRGSADKEFSRLEFQHSIYHWDTPNLEVCSTASYGKLRYAKTYFTITFKKDKWVLEATFRETERAFFANDVVRRMYIYAKYYADKNTNADKNIFQSAPTCIEIKTMINEESLSFLKNKNQTSPGLVEDFLKKTSYGKMMTRIFNDFGLQADRLEFFYEIGNKDVVYKGNILDNPLHYSSLRFFVSLKDK